jgi:hypothetical protein
MELTDAALKIGAAGKWQHFQKDFFYRLVGHLRYKVIKMGKDNNDVKGKFKILITILLPILAIIIPIALYMLQLQDKIFTYEIFSYSLINFSSSIEDEVEIRFSGKKVTDLTAINIVMKNAGDVPIRKEDFERNIAIGFGEEAKILKTIVKYKFPSNLVPIVNT